MTVSELFDSTIWIDYFIKGSFKEKIEKSEIFGLSALSLFEIRRKLLKNKELEKEEIEDRMQFIKKKSIIYNVDEKIADKASEIAEEEKLGAVDALIYATSILNDAILITLDNDFRGLKNVEIVG
ncbi:MAG: PIN domain-containing protein [Nanoarchaeota archaeon]|nr:PIN domain-containing protein [Nanoarchaeota archaeon]